MMYEVQCDNLLCIKTTGIISNPDGPIDYHRYEATAYWALDVLFEEYKLKRNDRVVDFGCGKGRVTFYIHHKFNVPVTGVEVNEATYEEALGNKESYCQKYNSSDMNSNISFSCCAAECYEVDPRDNVFYFFNPFSTKIFRAVVANILESVKKAKRSVDIILYYPMPTYELYLRHSSPFKLVDTIIIPNTSDANERFLIYRL